MSALDGIKYMEPVASIWEEDEQLGNECSDHNFHARYERGYGLLKGINIYFGFG